MARTWKRIAAYRRFVIADALGIEPGEHRPMALSSVMPGKAEVWERVRQKHALKAPPLESFVHTSFQLTDYTFRYGITEPETALVSTVKLHRAGFCEEIDTEDMFRKWFGRFQKEGLLPMPEASGPGKKRATA